MRARGGGLWRISDTHPAYDSLHFVLFHPHGEPGWEMNMAHAAVQPAGARDASDEEGDDGGAADGAGEAQAVVRRNKVTAREWACYHMHDRNPSGHALFVYGKRLFQEWLVDQYSKVESQRLLYLRNNQASLRAELYRGVVDAVMNNDTNTTNMGRLIVLPSSFTGGHRHMAQLYQDSMAIVRHFGKPDLFITMTCNPKWDEIRQELKPGETANDRPDLVTRVFRIKLQSLLDDLLKKGVFGKVVADIHVIEWQKRGLPHAHILVILHPDDKPRGPDDYGRIVSAELPDKDAHPELYDIITTCMLHGPCGTINPQSPCMVDGICTKSYPKAFQEHTSDTSGSYPTYRRRDDGRTFER